jgi:hypothetical protein
MLSQFCRFPGKAIERRVNFEIIAAIRPSGKRKILVDPRSSWMTNLGCSEFTDEEGNAISNLITEQVDSVTE